MAMTVAQLIARLKKFPPKALVAWQDHDQSDDEINGFVGRVFEADEVLYERFERETERGVAGKKIVILG